MFIKNTSSIGGGAARTVNGTSPTFSQCKFFGNVGTGWGGALNLIAVTDVNNCVFSGNSASTGGAVYNENASVFNNCTFSYNSSSRGGGMLNYLSVKPVIANCIFWGNSASSSGSQMFNDISHPMINYSDVQGGIGAIANIGGGGVTDGGGNINTDPLFINKNGRDNILGTEDDDVHLKSVVGRWTPGGWVSDEVSSPCIDAGNPANTFSREPLPNGAQINMGAYGNTVEASKSSRPPAGFALWMQSKGLFTSDPETVLQNDRDGDGVANGFEYAFGSNWISGQAVLNILFVNGNPVVEVPKQDADTIPYVNLLLIGCTNLLCAPDYWTLPVELSTNGLGKPANRDWYEPNGSPSNAFFRLKATLLQ
jgi:hypothetical protein